MTEQPSASGKGRATPSRKDSESARKKQLKIPTDRKAAKTAMRQREFEARTLTRKAMYTNDEKNLPARDRGPVRRFAREFVDRQISVGEMFVPLAFLILFVLFIPNTAVQTVASSVWLVMLVGMIADGSVISWRLRRALKTKFPDADHRGVTFYAVMRSLTFRPMRLPKPTVKIGGAPRTNQLPKSLR